MPEAPPRRGGYLRRVTIAVALVLAAVLLEVSLRGIDWADVARTVRRADPALLLLTAVLCAITMFLRGWRWRILLNAQANVSVSAAFWASSACLFANDFLPARAGELVRTYMIDAEYRLGKTYVLATAVAERIADAIVLLTIGATVLLLLPSPPGWLAGAAEPFAALGLVGAAAIAVLPLLGPLAERFITRLPLPGAWRDRLVGAVEQGLLGFRAFHDTGRVFTFVLTSVVIWTIDALGVVATAAALRLTISMSMAFVLLAGLGLGSGLPSTPGYVGIYQFIAVSVLTPFAISREDAIAFILVLQAVAYAVATVLGAYGLLRQRRRRRAEGIG